MSVECSWFAFIYLIIGVFFLLQKQILLQVLNQHHYPSLQCHVILQKSI